MEAWKEVEGVRRRILDRESVLVQEVQRLYLRSEGLLKTWLTGLTKELKGLERMDAPARFFQREKVQSLLRQIQILIDENAPAAAQVVMHAQRTAAVTGANDTLIWVGKAGITADWVRLPEHQLATLVGFMEDGTPLGERLAREGAEAAERAREVLFDGILNGRGSRMIGRQLQQAVTTITRANAVVIARTESHRCYRTAAIESYRYNSRVTSGWTWKSPKDARTCPACLALDGTIHPLTEHFGSHPSCRCVPVPIIIGRDINYGVQGKQWFAEQPARVQRRILGPAKHRLYEAGKIGLDDLVHRVPSRWGPTAGVKSLRQLVNEGTISAEDVLGARYKPIILRKEARERELSVGLATALERDVTKSQKGQLEGIFPASMPEGARRRLAKFEVVSKSPYSDSFYDITNKSWDDNPEGSLRMSDHWNFISQDTLHEVTDVIPPTNSWVLAKLQKGVYRVQKTWPKLGEVAQEINRKKARLFRFETAELKETHRSLLHRMLQGEVLPFGAGDFTLERLQVLGVMKVVGKNDITPALLKSVPKLKAIEWQEPYDFRNFAFLEPSMRDPVLRKLGLK